MTEGEGTQADKKRDIASSILINEQHREIYEENKDIFSATSVYKMDPAFRMLDEKWLKN